LLSSIDGYKKREEKFQQILYRLFSAIMKEAYGPLERSLLKEFL
jgi:hypothetical protein